MREEHQDILAGWENLSDLGRKSPVGTRTIYHYLVGKLKICLDFSMLATALFAVALLAFSFLLVH